jgi:hypothetical protein
VKADVSVRDLDAPHLLVEAVALVHKRRKLRVVSPLVAMAARSGSRFQFEAKPQLTPGGRDLVEAVLWARACLILAPSRVLRWQAGSVLPVVLQGLVTSLVQREFVRMHAGPVADPANEERSIMVFERTGDGLRDHFWLVRLEPEGWFVGSEFGTRVVSAIEVLQALKGEALDPPGTLPPLEEQVSAALWLADRFSTDHAVRERAYALFAPEADDPALVVLACGLPRAGEKITP